GGLGDQRSRRRDRRLALLCRRNFARELGQVATFQKIAKRLLLLGSQMRRMLYGGDKLRRGLLLGAQLVTRLEIFAQDVREKRVELLHLALRRQRQGANAAELLHGPLLRRY